MLLLSKASYFKIQKEGIHQTGKILSNKILEADNNPSWESYGLKFYLKWGSKTVYAI